MTAKEEGGEQSRVKMKTTLKAQVVVIKKRNLKKEQQHRGYQFKWGGCREQQKMWVYELRGWQRQQY